MIGGFAFAVGMSIAIALCQVPATPINAPKPLRERLLARALKGEADAQFELGKNYETGRIGLPRDLSEAQHWYRAAAEQGEPFAEFSLGVLFNFGKGVKRDFFQAYVWYQRAALHSADGDRDTMVEMRDRVAARLSRAQVAEAQQIAGQWKPAARK